MPGDTKNHFDGPCAARVRADGEPMADLRQQAPRWVLDVIDAVAFAQGRKDRTQLVNAILEKFASEELHRLSLIHRIAGSNPTVLEALGVRALEFTARANEAGSH